MKTVVVTLTPRDEEAKERLAKWAETSTKGGAFKKEFAVDALDSRGRVVFRMTSPINMPEKMIHDFLDPVINKAIIDHINKEKINTDISIQYE